MAFPNDPDPRLAGYAHPERLVTTQWLADHVGLPGLVVVECDEDVTLYGAGHIPGSVRLDWHTDLDDPVTRDYVGSERLAEVLSAKGIGRDDAVVLYSGRGNWWAAHALWVLTLFGHEDVRLLDGGRTTWVAENRELTGVVPVRLPTRYPVVPRTDGAVRAFRDDVRAHLGKPLVDVRSPQEYTGETLHVDGYPQEGALRGGHIPGARSVPWARAVADDGTFRSRAELEAVYLEEHGLRPTDDVITYCRIGERSSHTWFVLHHLLGFPYVRNYDGSWSEWGNTVQAPVAVGPEPGEWPGRTVPLPTPVNGIPYPAGAGS